MPGSAEPAYYGARAQEQTNAVTDRPAPIALFAYDRPGHLKRTLDALAANEFAPESDLIVFADGPRGERDEEGVAQVATVLAEAPAAFRSVTVHRRTTNRGLAGSIIEGIDLVLEEHDRIIVMEDDLITAPWFLRFANDALRIYENRDDVISVSGHSYPIEGLPETYFRSGADCWGWATWKRGWSLFRPDGAALLSELRGRGLENEFDLDGSCHYTNMLEEQVRGENDSWAIRWQASARLAGKFTLYPSRTLVHNIGHDGSGTHSGTTSVYGTEERLATSAVEISVLPRGESDTVYEAHRSYFERIHSVPPVPLPRRLAHVVKYHLLRAVQSRRRP
jgi:glycosyltransferase involved in cell wall biosynthesis